MQSEQQQRIMGYFIEEAKDHLNTIEQGLLSLQTTMEDREMLNEVFRAAHSVKGGAAMLGINSIQQTAHRLEDCFKVLQESPVTIDGQLESLFLRVFDTLQALVEQLQSPYGLSEETAKQIMSEAEPIFEELNTHLERLVHQTERSSVATVQAPKVAAVANSQLNTGNTKTSPAVFKRDVLLELREMLQLFKQQDLPEHRAALQEHCRHLARLGESLDLPGWDELLETARLAIAQPTNSYRLLANLVIKEIKQAQELVVAGRSVEIGVSEQLQALAPERTAAASQAHEPELTLTFDDDDSELESGTRESETGAADEYNWLQDENGSTYLFDSSNREAWEDTQDDAHAEDLFSDNTAEITFHETPTSSAHSRSTTSRFADTASVATPGAPPIEPEVGMAELNTLADIFEGQTPDLDQTWQEEEILNFDDEELAGTSGELFDWDDQNDFSDLVGDFDGWSIESDGTAIAQAGASASNSDDLMDLFGDDFSDTDAIAELGMSEFTLDTQQSTDLTRETHTPETPLFSTDTDDQFADLLFEEDSPDLELASGTSSNDLSSLFGESFFEEESPLEQNQEKAQFDVDAFLQMPEQEDELFAMPPEDDSEAEPWELLTSTDSSEEQEESLIEGFTDQENDFLTFEDTSQSWEDTDGDGNGFDFDDSIAGRDIAPVIEMLGASEQDELAQSDMDFSDLLEISQSDRFVAETPEDLEFGEELQNEDTAANFDFDALDWDESSDDFNFADNEDLTGSEDALADDTPSVAPAPTSFEELMGDGDEPELVLEDISFAEIDTASESFDLDFNLEATSASPFEVELQSTEDLGDLFEDEALGESEAPQSIDFEPLEDFDEFFDTPTAQTDSEALSEASVLTLEGLDSPTTEEPEAPDFDSLNAFFDAEEASDQEGEALPEAPELSFENSLDFEEFSIFDTPETTNDWESTEDLNLQEFDAQDDAFAQQLFELSSTDAEPIADLSFEASGEDVFDEELFDIGTSIESQEAESSTPEFELSSSTSDLEALFDDETLGETEATTVETPETSDLDLSSFALEQLNFDADLFGSDLFPSDELGVETQEASAPMFAFEEEPNNEGVTVSNSPESDWEALLGDDILEDSGFLNLSEENTWETEQTADTEQESAMSPMASPVNTNELISMDEFADLEAMLEAASASPDSGAKEIDVFQELDDLLEELPPVATPLTPASASRSTADTTSMEDAFGDLESLLEQAEKTMGGPPSVRNSQSSVRPMIRRGIRSEQNMRVPIKQLDSLSNLVGELVV
ncbi:MAG: Hpt domain-containing protein, partial [Cyanobacteriota bacterium]